MSFRNRLEKHCFEIAERVLGTGVAVEHNKVLQIETALLREVASFRGPPTKEIDVLVAELSSTPKVVLLVSCKLLKKRAEPAHTQEWCAVVDTMNRYSGETTYFGLVVSPTGFTSGCEAWATSHNLGLIPPLKGTKLAFSEDTILRMFERVITALRARTRHASTDLVTAPAFFDFVYRVVADFEGHQEASTDARYTVGPQHWASSFAEMVSALKGEPIQVLEVGADAARLTLSGELGLVFNGSRVAFGRGLEFASEPPATAHCWKNLELEPCSLELVQSVVRGNVITSAADFGTHLEFGIDHQFNLGVHPDGFHLISTISTSAEHRL
jgi:hypothetical protein